MTEVQCCIGYQWLATFWYSIKGVTCSTELAVSTSLLLLPFALFSALCSDGTLIVTAM